MCIMRAHPCSQVLDALFELDGAFVAGTKVEVGRPFFMGKAVRAAVVAILEDT